MRQTVTAVASYGKGDNDNFGFSNQSDSIRYGSDVAQGQIGLQLNVPIFSGGLTSSQVRQSYEQLNQSEQSREQLRREVVQNTRNLYRAVTSDVQQVQARKQSVISNQSSLEATQIGYQVGTRNIVDVLNAQRALYTSVRNYNDARYGYILDNLRPQAGRRHPQPGRPGSPRRLPQQRLQPGHRLPAARPGQGRRSPATRRSQLLIANQ